MKNAAADLPYGGGKAGIVAEAGLDAPHRTEVIEGAEWTKEGTYLREKIKQYQLDKVSTGHGRVWRLTYDGMPPDRTRPRMLQETAAQLVTHLSHPNGWWRDTAQQLLVLKQDKSVVPALQKIARSPGDQLARIHALWTLEGLASADAALVRQLMDLDDAPRAVGDAVVVAADRYEAIMADTAFQLQESVERRCRQRLQLGLLSGERLGDHLLGREMERRAGHAGRTRAPDLM